MDFEIEEEDSSDFQSQWSKPSKGGFFGGGFGGGGGAGKGEDVYDYDFGGGGGGGGEYEFSHYSSAPEKSKTPTAAKNSTANGKDSLTAKKTATSVSSSTSQMSAMEKAQSMLNKYSGKGNSTAAKKPSAPTKDYFSSDFNEDDISIGSDDLSTSGVVESPKPAKAARPQLTKGPTKPVHQQLSRGFDLEEDDDNDELVCPASALS
jgi:hypothetical protein